MVDLNLNIESKNYINQLNQYSEFIEEILTKIANEIRNFAIDQFEQQGFTDNFYSPWKEVEGKEKALIETGNLRNSIRIKEIDTTNLSVTVGSDEPYANIHNEGGTIKVSKKQKDFFWHMYNKTGNVKYKKLALSNKIEIPKRTFLAESQEMNKRINDLIMDEFNNINKKNQ